MARRNSRRQRQMAQIGRLESAVGKRLSRMRSAGVNTRSIDPTGPRDLSSSGQRDAYIRELKGFLKQPEFVAGRGGVPLPSTAVSEFRRLEGEWNRVHHAFWSSKARSPYISESGIEAPSALEMASLDVQRRGWSNPGYQRSANLENVRSLDDLKRRMAIMREEISPDFRTKRVNKLKDKLYQTVAAFNSPMIEAELDTLDPAQMLILAENTSIADIWFSFIDSDGGMPALSAIDQNQAEGTIVDLIRSVKQVDTPEDIRARMEVITGNEDNRPAAESIPRPQGAVRKLKERMRKRGRWRR